MSAIEIIIICVGALLVVLYAYFSIKKTLKFNKMVKHLMQDEHLTKQQAITLANKEIYKKKGKKNIDQDEIFKD